MICINFVGMVLHALMEKAQRKAFLDTRNCIQARLDMEDENERLVSIVYQSTTTNTLANQFSHASIGIQ